MSDFLADVAYRVPFALLAIGAYVGLMRLCGYRMTRIRGKHGTTR